MALDLALEGRQASIATTLLKHGASVTTTDPSGASLLHRAVRRGMDSILFFLTFFIFISTYMDFWLETYHTS